MSKHDQHEQHEQPREIPYPTVVFRQTVSLWRELEATRESMTTTRMVYEDTVGQRQNWRQSLAEEERAKKEADGRCAVASLARSR